MRFVDTEALAHEGKLLDLLYYAAGDQTLLPEIRERYQLFQRAIHRCFEPVHSKRWAEFVEPKVAFGPDDLLRCRLAMARMLHRDDYLALGESIEIDRALLSDLRYLPEYLDRLVAVAKAAYALTEISDAHLRGVKISESRLATQFKTPLIEGVPTNARWPLSAADEKNLTERGFKRHGRSWTRCLKVAPDLVCFDELAHPDDAEEFYDEEGNPAPDSGDLPAR